MSKKSMHYALNVIISERDRLAKFYRDTPQKYNKVMIPRGDLKSILINQNEVCQRLFSLIEALAQDNDKMAHIIKLSSINSAYRIIAEGRQRVGS